MRRLLVLVLVGAAGSVGGREGSLRHRAIHRAATLAAVELSGAGHAAEPRRRAAAGRRSSSSPARRRAGSPEDNFRAAWQKLIAAAAGRPRARLHQRGDHARRLDRGDRRGALREGRGELARHPRRGDRARTDDERGRPPARPGARRRGGRLLQGPRPRSTGGRGGVAAAAPPRGTDGATTPSAGERGGGGHVLHSAPGLEPDHPARTRWSTSRRRTRTPASGASWPSSRCGGAAAISSRTLSARSRASSGRTRCAATRKTRRSWCEERLPWAGPTSPSTRRSVRRGRAGRASSSSWPASGTRSPPSSPPRSGRW